MPSGIIIKGIGGFYYVKTPEGVFECKARGVFRKKAITPLPGDKVSVSIVDISKGIGNIEEIESRESELVRPAVANVDQVAVVIAIKSPQPDLLLLDKLIVTAEYKGLNTVICINKIDLDKSGEYKKIASAYSKAGYKVISSSFISSGGYGELKEVLNNRVTVFAGQSGVGKSTILNMIMDSEIMKTGKVSEKINRGKHTTRHAQLIDIGEGGYIVDTPGFSSFEVEGISHGELQFLYPEFNKYLGMCKYTGCSHISEPQCRIKQAIEDKLIDAGRYERYIEIYNFLKVHSDNRYRQ